MSGRGAALSFRHVATAGAIATGRRYRPRNEREQQA